MCLFILWEKTLTDFLANPNTIQNTLALICLVNTFPPCHPSQFSSAVPICCVFPKTSALIISSKTSIDVNFHLLLLKHLSVCTFL